MTVQTKAAAKRTISGPSELFAAADQRLDQQKFGTFSEYVRGLIRRDLDGKLNVAPAPATKTPTTTTNRRHPACPTQPTAPSAGPKSPRPKPHSGLTQTFKPRPRK